MFTLVGWIAVIYPHNMHITFDKFSGGLSPYCFYLNPFLDKCIFVDFLE